MKKLRKLLAGFLVLVLAISMVPMLAPITANATQTTTDATIDTDQAGSLTIHKYEYNGTEVITGTGSASDQVPTGSNPLAGAGFTIYKVQDVDDLATYYSMNPTTLPDVSAYVENGAIKAAYANTKVGNEVITGSTGIAEFTNLQLGFYVVVETTKPAAVTSAVDPFLVSIPMTTKDGEDWLYDVHVYPKNGTKYGEVKLEKTAYDDTSVKLNGVTFVLQKLDTVDSDKDSKTDDWVTITKKAGAAGDNTGDDLTLTTNESGIISVDGLTQGTYRFIETSRGDNHGYIMDGAAAYQFVITDEGKVTYGGTTAETITIPVKNDKPDLTKEVKKGTSWGQEADYSVGDKVPYQITVDVPANITQLKEFTVTDTPTNLKNDTTTVALKYGADKTAATADGASAVAAEAYTVTQATGENGFTITFDPTKMSTYAGKTIVISYQAELLSGAVTTTDGNPNTAKLVYSNSIKPNSSTDPDNPNNDPDDPTDDEPGKDAIEDNAVVYTFKIQILKKAETAAGTPLADVEFDLYKEDSAGTITGDVAEAIGLDDTKTWTKINTASLKTNATGEVNQSGLANGTYYLVETKTNAGYNLLKAPLEITLNVAYVTTTKTEYYKDSTGGKTLVKHEIDTQVFNSDSTVTEGIHTETIINKSGFTLPTTGGVGTYIFVFVGVSMMAAAVILFVISKKKDAAKRM